MQAYVSVGAKENDRPHRYILRLSAPLCNLPLSSEYRHSRHFFVAIAAILLEDEANNTVRGVSSSRRTLVLGIASAAGKSEANEK